MPRIHVASRILLIALPNSINSSTRQHFFHVHEIPTAKPRLLSAPRFLRGGSETRADQEFPRHRLPEPEEWQMVSRRTNRLETKLSQSRAYARMEMFVTPTAYCYSTRSGRGE